MKYYRVLLTACFAIALSFEAACQPDLASTEPALSEDIYKKQLLLDDFDQLVKAFVVKHPKAFTNMDEFESTRLIQRAKIADMSEREFFRVLAPVVEKINCGHTFIENSSQYSAYRIDNGQFLPFDIKVVNAQLFLVADVSGSGIEKGSRIISIDGNAASEIINALYHLYPSDGNNLSSKQAQLNYGFKPYLSFEMAYQIMFGSRPRFLVEYAPPGKKEVSSVSVAASNYTLLEWQNKSLSFEYKNDYAILTIPHFNTYSSADFTEFSESLNMFFHRLSEKKIDNLILDLRGNSGGDPNAGNLLLTYLLSSTFQYFANGSIKYFYGSLTRSSEINKNAFNGKLFVLVDGLAFSTTGHVLSHIIANKRAITIGQESGGGYICNDGAEWVTLDNTKIGFNVATFAFETSVKGQVKGQGIMPDIKITHSIIDYLQSTDLEMQAALRLIQND